jgi:hypothetical protein
MDQIPAQSCTTIFCRDPKMPATLKEARAEEGDLEVMAEKAVERGNLGILASIGKEEALEIMRAAF